jgi:hypothetical protein
MVEKADMVISQVLCGLDKVAQPREISPKLGERNGNASMHTDFLMASEQRPR